MIKDIKRDLEKVPDKTWKIMFGERLRVSNVTLLQCLRERDVRKKDIFERKSQNYS